MNFAAHAVVADRLTGHPDVALGAVVPDLLPHSGAVAARPFPEAVEVGRRLHHATDAVFHRHPVFLALQRAVYDELTRGGVARGPARAAAHLGVELLLDGALVTSGSASAFDALWARLRAPDQTVRALVVASNAPAWEAWLAAFTGFLEPARYADPVYSAARIERILRHRPRLSLPVDHVSRLVDVLAAINPTVHDRAREMVGGLVDALTNPPRPGTR